jgi:hypothetical protein
LLVPAGVAAAVIGATSQTVGFSTTRRLHTKEALINSTKLVIVPGGHKHPEGINERSAAISESRISRSEIASLPKGILQGTAFLVYALRVFMPSGCNDELIRASLKAFHFSSDKLRFTYLSEKLTFSAD